LSFAVKISGESELLEMKNDITSDAKATISPENQMNSNIW
jgi:hypothetical protein